MPVPANAHDAFSAAITAIFSTESVNLQLLGKIDASFSIPLLPVNPILSVGLDVTNEIKGFNGLLDVTFVSLVSNTPDESNKKQTIALKVNVKSPSIIGIKLGDILFNTAGPAEPIGTATLKDVVLKLGDNLLTAIVVIDLSLAGAAEFVSGLETADATVTLTGTGSSPVNPVILPAIQSLKINFVIPHKFTPKTT
ncbi:hypothetical protein BG005_009110 [Podila minutissima]|nr:hypothetical protein BG005_009110 [Podila minutissima]